jgi:cytochrome P450
MTLGQCPFSATHDLDALHEDLRTRGAGVHEAELSNGSPVWVVTGYDAVTRLLADPQVVTNKAASTTGFRGNELPPALDANLLNVDGADHRRIRRLATEAFGSRNHPEHERIVKAAVVELVEQLPATGEVDVMGGLCEPLPPRVIGELLGLSHEQLRAFQEAARPMFKIDPSHPGEGVPDAVRNGVMQMLMLVGGVIADKRRRPGSDLLSLWLQARDGEDRLSEEELMSLVSVTVFGGLENVTSLTALVLDEVVREHIEHARAGLGDEAGFRKFIREIMGNMAPVNYARRRFPLTDIEVNGVTIPKGHTVMLSLRSAHVDPAGQGRPDLVFRVGPSLLHRCSAGGDAGGARNAGSPAQISCPATHSTAQRIQTAPVVAYICSG